MRSRIFAAIAMIVVLGVVAASASASGRHQQANKLTVWLQVDAQSGWPDLVAAANQQFQNDHPGWTVDVQYQGWPDHLQKFDASLAGNTAPDVIEMGNTEMTKYMAAGAFADLTSLKSSFPNSANWLKGLAASGTFGGKTYGVPYYAGSRVVTYRNDLFKNTPSSLAQFITMAKSVGAKDKAKGFSPIYVAGTDWYVAMSFVADYGGKIATTSKGKWVGTLESPASLAGLAAYKTFFTAVSKGGKTADENRPQPYDVYAQGNAGAILGPGWFSCCTGAKYKTTTAQFPMPSHVKGQVMPGFLGGSDLAVPVSSGNKALAAAWIADFTSTASEKGLQAKGNIPNATNLLGTSVNERAAARSWFVPQAKHWVDVENGNILRNMLAQILTGKQTIKQAAQSADSNIALVLNGA
jgi:N,N'-diacetylchitobiose transport system substrate-binding protein